MTEMEGFGILCDGDGRKRRFADFTFPKWTETEVCKFCVSAMDGNGSFADFAFPKWTETEVCQFSSTEIDGNGGLQILLDGNGQKLKFCFRRRRKRNFHFHPFPSSPFSVFRVTPLLLGGYGPAPLMRRYLHTWFR